MILNGKREKMGEDFRRKPFGSLSESPQNLVFSGGDSRGPSLSVKGGCREGVLSAVSFEKKFLWRLS